MHAKKSASLFGQRLREARFRYGIAQDKLGVAVGLDEGTASARISRYETGIHEPPFEFALRLAKVLGVPVTYFYCDDPQLLEVILAWGKMVPAEREALMSSVSTLGDDGE